MAYAQYAIEEFQLEDTDEIEALLQEFANEGFDVQIALPGSAPVRMPQVYTIGSGNHTREELETIWKERWEARRNG